jgi:hypothetical protein
MNIRKLWARIEVIVEEDGENTFVQCASQNSIKFLCCGNISDLAMHIKLNLG